MPPQHPDTFEAHSPQKTTLFCPGCGHQSDIAGDWTVRTVADRRVLDCPVCEIRITGRLREAPPPIPND